jgi:type IV secretion system protein VirB10
MAEQTPPNESGAVPVVDRRTTPRGVIPRSAQTWLMLGLAVAILGIIAITGSPESGPRQVNTPTQSASTPNPSRLRDYQDRLRLLDERARMEAMQSSSLAPAPAPQVQAVDTPPQPDPLADERRRREYESRFARVSVLARHPERHVPPLAAADGHPARSGSQEDVEPGSASAAPSLDAVAEAVLRASSRQAPAGVAPATQVASPASPASVEADKRPAPLAAVAAGSGLHRIPEGTLLETVLWNKLTLTGEAPVICRVTTPVYSRDLQHVVIPADTLVLGQSRVVGTGDDPLLAVAFTQLRMPDDTRYELKQASALNREGDAGLRDRLDRHYPSIFGAAGAIGLITGLAQAIAGRTASAAGADRTVIIAGSAADASTQAATQALGHFLNRRPTGTIRRGHRVLVYLTQNLDLPTYARPTSGASSIR